MLRDGQETIIDVVPLDSRLRTYVIKDGIVYKIDDGTQCMIGDTTGIMKSYRSFLSTQGELTALVEGDELKINDPKYFDGVLTITTVTTSITGDLDVVYNALDLQRMYALTLNSGFEDIKTDDISVDGMTVTIQPLEGVIDGLAFNIKESQSLPISAGLSQSRVDLLVLRKDQTQGTVNYYVKEGELGSNIPPELTQIHLGVYELPVCKIFVTSFATTLELGNITDLRNYLLRQKDKPIPDTGSGLNPQESSNIVLTNEATTRTLSAGLWAGQTVMIFNSTANTITVTDGPNTFDIPANRHFTYVWTGSRWKSKLVYVGQILTWRPEDKDNTSRGVVKGDFALDRTPWAITGTNTTEWEQIWMEGVYELSGVGDEVSESVGGVYEAEIANVAGSVAIPLVEVSTNYITDPFKVEEGIQTAINRGVEYTVNRISFNLSRNSDVFKDSASNHPKHIRVRQYQYIGV